MGLQCAVFARRRRGAFVAYSSKEDMRQEGNRELALTSRAHSVWSRRPRRWRPLARRPGDPGAGPERRLLRGRLRRPVRAAAGWSRRTPDPPDVEGAPIPAQGGGYCYRGSTPGRHPRGARAAWEDVAGSHIRHYPPFNLRLFSYHQGCYYFIGDPRDFGYTGQSYSYYGAHPVPTPTAAAGAS